jgi:hypothetical protein
MRVAPHKKKTLIIFERNAQEETQNEYYGMFLDNDLSYASKIIPSDDGNGRYEVQFLDTFGGYNEPNMKIGAIITTTKGNVKIHINGETNYSSMNGFKFRKQDQSKADLSFLGEYRTPLRRGVVRVSEANGEPNGLFIRTPEGEFLLVPIIDGFYRAYQSTSVNGNTVNDKTEIKFIVRFAYEDRLLNQRRLYILDASNQKTTTRYTLQKIQ